MAIKLSLDLDRVVLFAPARLQLQTTLKEFRGVIRALFQNELKDIICDFSECEYIDSSGLGELVSSFTYCSRHGGSFALNQLTPKVRELLTVSKLVTVFPVYSVDYSGKWVFPVSIEDVNALKLLQDQVNGLTLFLVVRSGRLRIMASRRDRIVRITVGDKTNPSPVAALHLIVNVTQSCVHEEIEKFEELINTASTRAPDIQSFLARHPKSFLRPQSGIYLQVVFEREDAGPPIPGFFLQPLDTALRDLVDLKLPDVPLTPQKPDTENLATAIAEAAALLKTYSDHLDVHRTKMPGIEAYRPRLAVIVDRRPEIQPALYEQAQNGTAEIEDISNDQLIERARQAVLV